MSRSDSVRFLENLRVIEVSLLSPSALGGHLAELGADVVKVEQPGIGDYVRHIGRRAGQDVSDLHRYWNRGKRSIELDLKSAEGKERFRALVSTAEVVVDGGRPGSLRRLGLGYDELQSVRPAIVFVSLSGFGNSGPYRDMPSHGPAFDAYAGLLAPELDSRGRPRIPAVNYSLYGIETAPLQAAMSTLAAVVRARATGLPTYLDIAQSDAAAYTAASKLSRLRSESVGTAAVAGGVERDDMPDDLFDGSVLVQYYRTGDDRYILFQALERKFFERFCTAVDRRDLIAEFPDDRSTDWLYGRDDIRAQMTDLFRSRTLSE